MTEENIILVCTVTVVLCIGIILLPYTIDAYIIMSLYSDLRSYCGF